MFQCQLNQFQRFLPLIGGVELEGQVRCLSAAEQRLFQAVQIGFAARVGGEYLAKVSMNRRGIVDDEYAAVDRPGLRTHGATPDPDSLLLGSILFPSSHARTQAVCVDRPLEHSWPQGTSLAGV